MIRLVKRYFVLIVVTLLQPELIFSADDEDSVIDQLSLYDILNVKVTVASKTAENISDAPGVISVITQDELNRFGGTTLSDILNRVPSFLKTTAYFVDRSVISTRGDHIKQFSGHTLLLLNGRPVREIMDGGIKSEMYESFPVNVIDRIEVIRGPGSVLYGSQAFSAVINVITKKTEDNTISLSGALGEGLKNNIMADLQYKSGDLNIVLAGRYADKGGWKTGYNARADIPEVTLGVVHHMDVTIPDYGPGAYAEVDYKDFKLMGSYNEWNNHNFIPDVEFLNTLGILKEHTVAKVGWKKLFSDLGYKHAFTDWYNTSANVTYTYSNLEARGFPFILRESYEALAEITNFFTPVTNLNIVVGGVYSFQSGIEQNANNDTTDWNRGIYNKGHYGNNFSGYIQSDYHWNWCKVIGGLQINKVFYEDSSGKIDDFKADFNPRIGAIFYPLDNINIKALYSTAYRAPSMNELYLNYTTMAGKMVPRMEDSAFAAWEHEYNLKPEKVYTYDLGASYQDNKVEFGINGFYSHMKNLITEIVVSPNFDIYDNTGEIVAFGLECEGEYYISKSLFIEGSFLYQQSRNISTNEENITPLPNFSAKGGLSYKSESGLTISVFNTFQQSVDPKYYDALNPSTGYFNMMNMHCSYDLNTILKFHTVNELSLVLNIDNVLDEEIWLPAWGLQTGEMIPFNQGRTIYGGIKVSF
jgi:outer membrane receptor protein involved in Fe transport